MQEENLFRVCLLQFSRRHKPSCTRSSKRNREKKRYVLIEFNLVEFFYFSLSIPTTFSNLLYGPARAYILIYTYIFFIFVGIIRERWSNFISFLVCFPCSKPLAQTKPVHYYHQRPPIPSCHSLHDRNDFWKNSKLTLKLA